MNSCGARVEKHALCKEHLHRSKVDLDASIEKVELDLERLRTRRKLLDT